MKLSVTEFELEKDTVTKAGTKYVKYLDENGVEYRPQEGLVIFDEYGDMFEKVVKQSTPDSVNCGAPRMFKETANYVHPDLPELDTEVTWTITTSIDTEMDKETFVMLVEAIEQHQNAIMDVKELIRNVDGHTCLYDHLPNSMIDFLSDEFQTDLVALYFFELDLEVVNADALYDLIMESRKCC